MIHAVPANTFSPALYVPCIRRSRSTDGDGNRQRSSFSSGGGESDTGAGQQLEKSPSLQSSQALRSPAGGPNRMTRGDSMMRPRQAIPSRSLSRRRRPTMAAVGGNISDGSESSGLPLGLGAAALWSLRGVEAGDLPRSQ